MRTRHVPTLCCLLLALSWTIIWSPPRTQAQDPGPAERQSEGWLQAELERLTKAFRSGDKEQLTAAFAVSEEDLADGFVEHAKAMFDRPLMQWQYAQMVSALPTLGPLPAGVDSIRIQVGPGVGSDKADMTVTLSMSRSSDTWRTEHFESSFNGDYAIPTEFERLMNAEDSGGLTDEEKERKAALLKTRLVTTRNDRDPANVSKLAARLAAGTDPRSADWNTLPENVRAVLIAWPGITGVPAGAEYLGLELSVGTYTVGAHYGQVAGVRMLNMLVVGNRETGTDLKLLSPVPSDPFADVAAVTLELGEGKPATGEEADRIRRANILAHWKAIAAGANVWVKNLAQQIERLKAVTGDDTVAVLTALAEWGRHELAFSRGLSKRYEDQILMALGLGSRTEEWPTTDHSKHWMSLIDSLRLSDAVVLMGIGDFPVRRGLEQFVGKIDAWMTLQQGAGATDDHHLDVLATALESLAAHRTALNESMHNAEFGSSDYVADAGKLIDGAAEAPPGVLDSLKRSKQCAQNAADCWRAMSFAPTFDSPVRAIHSAGSDDRRLTRTRVMIADFASTNRKTTR